MYIRKGRGGKCIGEVVVVIYSLSLLYLLFFRFLIFPRSCIVFLLFPCPSKA